MRILLGLLLSTLAVIISAYLLPGVRVDGFISALAAAVVLAFVNAFLRPLLLLLTLPINIPTLGLFTFVVIGFCVQLVTLVVPGFHVQGFFWALFFALVLALVNAVLELFAGQPVAQPLG